MECHVRRAQREDLEAISRIVIAALRASNSPIVAATLARHPQHDAPCEPGGRMESSLL